MQWEGKYPQHHSFVGAPNFMAGMLIQQSTTVAEYYTPNATHTATVNGMDMLQYHLQRKYERKMQYQQKTEGWEDS